MKARNREINIFNMSLLDVLCGALGAFCFMMLVLFPYYKPKPEAATPPGPPPKNCEDCMKQHEEMQKQVEEAAARNAQLAIRNPFVVEMFPRFGGYDIDLYVNDDRQGSKGEKSAAPDATKEQDRKFEGDRYLGGAGAYPELWMVRDAPKGAYRVYYKVMKFNGDPTIVPTIVDGRFISGTLAVYLPKVAVTKVGEIFHVATITSDGEGGYAVKPERPDVDLDKFLQEREQLAQRQDKARQDEERRKQEEQKKQPEQKQPVQKKP